MQYAEAQKALRELIELKKTLSEEKLNEAETRKVFIDRILQDVLGWSLTPPTSYLERDAGNGTYFDYLFKTADGACRLIVEAKKDGICFSLPATTKDIIDVDLLRTTKPKSNRIFYEAIEQAIKYGRLTNTPYVMVSNGHQIAIALSQVSRGYDERYGHAVIFRSLEDIEKRLGELISLVASTELQGGYSTLDKILRPDQPFLAAYTLSHKIADYPRDFRVQNPRDEAVVMSTEIRNVCGTIVHGIDRNAERLDRMDDYIDNCYIDTFERQKFEESNEMPKPYTAQFAAAAQIPDLQPVTTMSGVNKLLLETASDPMIILGNVGVGKSIFIDYLICKNDYFRREAYIARINFRNLLTSDKSKILKEIADALLEAIRRGGHDPSDEGIIRDVYAQDISSIQKSFRSTPTAVVDEKIGDFLCRKREDIVQFAQDCAKNLAKKSDAKKLIVFLDNVDQKPPSEQIEIYTIARELMFEWKVHQSFIAMTPPAFYATKGLRGPRSTGHTRVFSITSPPVSMILKKRLAYIQKLMREDRLKEFGYSYTITSENNDKFMSVLVENLSQKERVGEMVAHLAGDNVRLATDIIYSYIEAPSTRVVEWSNEKKKYESISKISPNAFLASILKNEKADFYQQNNKWITNVFGVIEHDPREHFLSLALLQKMLHISENSNAYVPVDELAQWGMSYGYSSSQILHHILSLEEMRLIEPVDLNEHNLDYMAKSYRIRPSGRYHLHHLAVNSTYVEEMLKVTPIFSQSYKMDTDTFTIIKSVENALQFHAYLEEVYKGSRFTDEFLPHSVLDNLSGSILGKHAHFDRLEKAKANATASVSVETEVLAE